MRTDIIENFANVLRQFDSKKILQADLYTGDYWEIKNHFNFAENFKMEIDVNGREFWNDIFITHSIFNPKSTFRIYNFSDL
jgi:hypothetical protein